MTTFDAARGGWDEDGFHLRLVDADGDESDVRIRGLDEARELLRAVEPLREWVAEAATQEAAYLVASPTERARVLGLALDLDDPDAYEERTEALREGADLARKAAKEQ